MEAVQSHALDNLIKSENNAFIYTWIYTIYPYIFSFFNRQMFATIDDKIRQNMLTFYTELSWVVRNQDCVTLRPSHSKKNKNPTVVHQSATEKKGISPKLA